MKPARPGNTCDPQLGELSAMLKRDVQTTAATSEFRPLAIVGMACRLPGADDLDQYWDLIRRAGVAFGPLPESRLNRQLYYHPDKGITGKTYSDVGGIVSSRPFDIRACPLPDHLIASSDAAHLTLCEVAAAAVRDAGYDPVHFPERNCGVYIGHTGGSPWVSDMVYSTMVAEGARLLAGTDHFRQLGSAGQDVIDDIVRRVRRDYPGRRADEHFSFVECGAASAAGLIAKAFGLAGPYMVVDAACASSLQAMAVGIRSLLQGRIDAALVGGASYCKSDSLVLFSAAQSVSARHSCPFGAKADGLITAEGYVVLLIKTLERALADGDRIRAVIRGLGVSSDGKGRASGRCAQKGKCWPWSGPMALASMRGACSISRHMRHPHRWAMPRSCKHSARHCRNCCLRAPRRFPSAV